MAVKKTASRFQHGEILARSPSSRRHGYDKTHLGVEEGGLGCCLVNGFTSDEALQGPTIYLSIHLCISVLYVSRYVCICLSVCLACWLSVFVCPFVRLSIRPSIYQIISIYLSIYIYIYITCILYIHRSCVIYSHLLCLCIQFTYGCIRSLRGNLLPQQLWTANVCWWTCPKMRETGCFGKSSKVKFRLCSKTEGFFLGKALESHQSAVCVCVS